MTETLRFVVVGGGTAGWMSALLLKRAFADAQVTVIDASSIGTIGVGEGSTPALKSFFDIIGISEPEWMPRCGATYKSGIRFCDWSDKPGFESYFHPFITHFDRDHVRALEYNTLLRRQGVDVIAHPNLFCYSNYLAEMKLCPVTPVCFPFEVQYGYHFNAIALADYLKTISTERGIHWQDRKIVSVEMRQDGEVGRLIAADGGDISGDFYFDCSGFASILTMKALKVEFVPYDHVLFNDRSVTLLTERETHPSTETRATALSCGWAWKIPQQDRVGNGYVYSSRHATRVSAEKELLKHLGKTAPDYDFRHIEFRTGRVARAWNGNVLAVGLAQGFLEPLEATALALVQFTITRFLKSYSAGGLSAKFSSIFNAELAEAYECLKDYLHAHYLTSSRKHSKYWIDCRESRKEISNNLSRVFDAWFSSGDLSDALTKTGLGKFYKLNSWLYLLSGMGIFPSPEQLIPPKTEYLNKVPVDFIKNFFERCSLNHISQEKAFEFLKKGQVPFGNVEIEGFDRRHDLETFLAQDFGVSAVRTIS